MRRSFSSTWWALVALLAWTACGDDKNVEGPVPGSWEGVCVDADKDGFGVQCEAGPDCDDSNSAIHTDCGCSVPNDSCQCESGAAPVNCVISRKFTDSGSLLCSTGKRYCRDNAWTQCIGAVSFEVPPPAEFLRGLLQEDAAPQSTPSRLAGAVIDPDEPHEVPDPCNPERYRVTDSLEIIPADPAVTTGAGGGLTLVSMLGSDHTNPDAIDPNPRCMRGVIIPQFGQLDDDCDGIPDDFDRSPGVPPWDSNHPAITMDLAPGEQNAKTFELQFKLNTVDVYFLLDTTASMDGELNRLITDLTSGTFLDNPATTHNEANDVVCASPYGTTTSDPTLKTKGITGNIACLVPNSGFGAGFFREIPFDNPDSSGNKHAYDWFIPYEHRQDISTNVQDTLTALKKFYTAGNQSWAENDMFALSAVATGSQLYVGWDRPGIEARTCPDPLNQFGWPCFRKEAIPMVVLITDASMMNGPNVDVYKNNTSSCFSSSSPFTNTTTDCTHDGICAVAYPNLGAFCSKGKCSYQNAISAACAGGDGPDGKVGTAYSQALNYTAGQTNTVSATRDATYHPVPRALVGGAWKDTNEDYLTAVDVGTIDDKFITYVGDTRGMSPDVYSSNLGTVCAQWPTTGSPAATSAATPGYPDAVYRFRVEHSSKPLTISTQGSNHAPTLAIISTGAAGTSGGTSTTVTALASSDTAPWSFAGTSQLPVAFDYSIGVDLTSFAGSWPRSSFGECMTGSPGATDYASDAVFSFTPSTNVQGVSFTTGASQIFPSNDLTANTSPGVDFGPILGQWYDYYGSTSGASNKWTSAQLGTATCRENATTMATKEHVFKFTLNTTAKLEFTLSATAPFDPVLSLFGNGGATAQPNPGSTIANPRSCSRNASGNEVISGTYTAGTYYLLVHGYNGTNNTGAYTLSVREQSDEAIALYDSAPSAPESFAITGPNPPDAPNTNDVFYDYHLGQIDGRYLRLNAGDTSVASIKPDYVEDSFKAALGSCSNVTGLSKDAVVEFSVAQTRTIRVETFDGTGLDPNQSAGFDHVVALVERPAKLTVTPVPVTDNDAVVSARAVTAASVPTAEGDYSQYTGATFGNGNTIAMSPSIDPQEMFNPANPETTTCSLVDSELQDSVYKFTVDAASAGVYNFDTIGSQSTTFLSLHKGNPDTFASIAPGITPVTVPASNGSGSSSPSGPQTGVSLGTVDLNTINYASATDAGTANKWTDAHYQGCRLPGGDAAREHVFNFVVGTARTVTITLNQTAPYDASIALFAAPPNAGQTQIGLRACTRISGAVSSNPGGLTSVGSGVMTGNLTAGTYYLVVHGYQNANNSGSYSLSVEDVNTRVSRTVPTNDAGAGGGQTANGVDLGSVSGKTVNYTGATSTTSTTNKWTAAQAGAGNGCRQDESQDSTREHVLRFSVTGSAKTLNIGLTRTGGWAPVVSVLQTNAPAVNTAFGSTFIGCQRAYTTSSQTVGGLTFTGNATSGANVSGSFPVGTYYLVINGQTNNAVGTYSVVVADTAGAGATPSWADNSQDSLLNGSPSGSTAPFADIGVLTDAGAAYNGRIISATPKKWTGAQIATPLNTKGCRQNTSTTTGEHLFRFTLTAPSTVSVAVSSVGTASAFDTAVTLFGPASSAPTSGSTVPSATVDICNDDLAAGNTDSLIGGTYLGAGTYYVLVHAYGSSGTGTYELQITSSPDATARWATNSQDTTLNGAATGAAPFVDLGDATTAGKYYAGTTSTGTPSKWTGAQLGSASCRAAPSSATAEHVFKLNLTTATTLNLVVTSNFAPVLSLFGPSGSVPTTGTIVGDPVACNHGGGGSASLIGTYAPGAYYVMVHGYDPAGSPIGNYALSIANVAAPTSAWANNIQDTTLNGSATSAAPSVHLGTLDATTPSASYSGTTSTSTPNKWTGLQLGTASCRSNPSNTGSEHVFTFTLPATTTVSLNLSSSYDSVLSLIGPLGSTPSTHTMLSGAVQTCNRAGAGGSLQGTYPAGTYYLIVHGYNQGLTGTYSLALSTALTTPTAPWTNNSQNTTLNGPMGGVVDFGTLTTAGASYRGTTSTSTPNRWTHLQLGAASCRRPNSSGSTANAVHEHVFKFTLAASTDLTIDVGDFSSAVYDPVVSLIGIGATGVVPATGATLSAGDYTTFTCDNDSGPGDDAQLSGTYAAGTYYVIVQGYQDSLSAGSYSLDIRPPGTASWSTDTQNTTPLNGTGTSPYADFGTLGSSPVYYTGETRQSATPSKWSSTEFGSASCRASSNVRDRHEHMFRFYLASAATVTATLSLPGGSDFDRPVLSIFGPSASAPAKLTSVENPLGCSYAATGSEVVTGTYDTGYYYVMVHGYDTDDNGAYTLRLATGVPSTFAADSQNAKLDQALYSVPIADFGTLGTTGQLYTGSTSSGTSKWTGTQLGASSCRTSTTTASNEHVFKFTLSATKTVRLALNAGFDSALSLFGASSLAPLASTLVPNPNACDRTASGDDVLIGTYPSGTYYVVVHGFATADSGTYTVSLTPFVSPAATTFAANSQNTTLNYSPTAPTADFGTIATTPLSYTGLTSASTSGSWTSAHLGSASCRAPTGSDAVKEHVFQFTVVGAPKTLTLQVAANFDSTLSVFGPSGTTPAVGVPVASPNDCNRTSSGDDTLTATFAPGTYYVIVHAYTNAAVGTYTVSLTPQIAPTGPTFAANSQDAALNAGVSAALADFGTLGAAPAFYTGTTSISTPNKWSSTQLGSASCRTAGATPGEHLFKFTLAAPTNLNIRLNANFDSALSLFGATSSQPVATTTMPSPNGCNRTGTSTADDVLSGLLPAGTYYIVVHGNATVDRGNYTLTLTPPVSSPSATWDDDSQNSALDSTEVALADFGALGAVGVSYTGSTSGGTSKWTSAQVATGASPAGCRADGTKLPKEHVFRFTLATPSQVNLSLVTGFNPVLSLFGPSTLPPVSAQTVSNPVGCYHDPALNSNSTTITNGTASLAGTYPAGTYYVLVHGYNTTASAAGSYTLTITRPALVTIATDDVGADSTTASPTAVDLGVADNSVVTYTGTTSTGAPNKWTNANVRGSSTGTGAPSGCRSTPTQNSGREHLLRFTVGTGRSVRVQLNNGTLNGVLSVYKGPTLPAANTDISAVNPMQGCTHATTPASDAVLSTAVYTASGGSLSGTFTSGTYYALVHGYNSDNVGTYTLTLTDTSVSYGTVSVPADPALANGSGPQSGINLGTADDRAILYSGDTTGAVNKWTQANVSSSGNTGCRDAGNDVGREHVLALTVSSARRLALRLSRPAGSTYQPVVSIFGGGAPVVGSDVAGLMACSRLTSAAPVDNVTVAPGFIATDGLITGLFPAGVYYLVVHGYQGTNNQGAYTLQVLDASPVSLGVADVGRRVTIDGDTTATTGVAFNQWQGGDFPLAGGVPNGGRWDGAQRTNERLYSFNVTGATKTLTVGLTGTFDSVLSVFDALPVGGGAVTGHLESQRAAGTYNRGITRSFAPGTYYVMVHGYRASAAPAGAFTLSVGDDTWQNNLVACNSRGTGSQLTAMNLTPGDYYVVVKSGAGTGLLPAGYRYTLNMRRTFNQPFIACDYEGFGPGSRRGFVEATVYAGKTYAAVVRGVTPSDAGTYGLVIRDVTAGTAPLGCGNSAGYTTAAGDPGGFTADLTAGRTYYVAVRSNSSSNVGQANVRISNFTTSTCAFNNVTFDAVGTSAGVSPYVPSKVVAHLPVGEYYAVVKGNRNLIESSVKIPTGSVAGNPDDRGRGRYQITFGDATLAVNNQTFAAPLWGTSTTGVYGDLLARGIRVLTVNSLPSAGGSADLFMREQSKAISSATGALDVNGAPIRRNIGADGTGMGFAIVDAVAKFTDAVQMDISVRLTLSPDDPGLVEPFNRRFVFLSRAVPAPAGTSNGCAAPIDTNGDSVLDTHTACGPGATPRFEIKVTNPAAPNSVPPNLADLGRGYLMTLQLVGKDRLVANAVPQIVDDVPLYVIPEAVLPDLTVVYQASGTYTQTVEATSCSGNEVPTWRSLHYTDTLPSGTAMEWRVCGGDDDAELAACDAPAGFVVAARVTPGATCTDSSTCPNGFCNVNRCEYPVGPSCVSDTECGAPDTGSACVASQCTWSSDPNGRAGIQLRPAVAQRFLGKKKLRVQVKLESNPSHSAAPTIHDFKLNYDCAQQE